MGFEKKTVDFYTAGQKVVDSLNNFSRTLILFFSKPRFIGDGGFDRPRFFLA